MSPAPDDHAAIEAALGAQIDSLFADLDPAREQIPDLAALARVGSSWKFRLEPFSAEMVTQLARNFAAALAATDPADVRPSLYGNDPVAEAEWQARGDDSLLDGRRQANASLIAALEGALMGGQDCLACVRALTDMRVHLFKMSGEPDAWTEDVEPADAGHAIYAYLGYLTASLMAAVGAA